MATLVLWGASLAVGVAGLIFHLRLLVAHTPEPPVEAELLNVQTVAAQPPVAASPPAAVPPSPLSSIQPPDLPPIPSPTSPPAFVEPSLAVPHLVQARRAPTTAPITATPAPVIQLTFGQGEGAQPAPEYPAEAIIVAEEGTVGIRLTVDESGEVTDAVASSPCRWPILNKAAVRAVRDTWHFPRGRKRVYEVSIEFRLNKHEEP